MNSYTDEHVSRLQAAIEGECNGVAVDEVHARAILAYVFGVIPREEWQRRYAAQIMERAGWPEHAAIEAARVGAEEHERTERAAGNAVVWLGAPTGRLDTPEEQADEEMSCWENDGEG